MKFTNIVIFLIFIFLWVKIFDSPLNEKVSSKIFDFFKLLFSAFWAAITWCRDIRTAQSELDRSVSVRGSHTWWTRFS